MPLRISLLSRDQQMKQIIEQEKRHAKLTKELENVNEKLNELRSLQAPSPGVAIPQTKSQKINLQATKQQVAPKLRSLVRKT